MKKLRISILGTASTLIIASALSTAQAEVEVYSRDLPQGGGKVDIKVGGYFDAMAALGTTDIDGFSGDDFDGVDVKADGEIVFTPTITLDNGLKFGLNIQLEARSSRDVDIDESYIFVKGSFGEVLLGDHNSAGYRMGFSAPSSTLFGNNDTGNFEPEIYDDLGEYTRVSGFVSDGTTFATLGGELERNTLGTTYIENDGIDDATRISYFSPRFSGFQLGVSYARDGRDGSNEQVNCDTSACDFFDIGANYVQDYGDFDVALSARWGTASAPFGSAEDPEVFGFGLNLGFAGVTIGGSFAEQNGTPASDGESYDAGVAYETGPWDLSATYFNGENVDNENAFAAVGVDPNEEFEALIFGANYNLTQGVTVNTFGAFTNFEEDIGDGGVGTVGSDVEGFIIGSGIRIQF